MKEAGQLDGGSSPMMPAAMQSPPPMPEVKKTPSIVEIGEGEGKIPIDASNLKNGDKVKVIMTCTVKGNSEPNAGPSENGVQNSTGSLEIESAEVEPEKAVSNMGEKEVGEKLDSALNTDEIPKS